MIATIIVIFIIGYTAIVLEHPLKLDKTIPAILTGALLWAIVSLSGLGVVNAEHQAGEMEGVLLHHVGKIAEILFFLIGAMVIVELIDLHRGFSVITNRIRTTKKTKLLWLISIIAFFLSSVLDNLTTTIVMISLLRKLVPDRMERVWFVSFVVIAANAGGAWSPIGDVTTTMLWIGKKITTPGLIEDVFIPSILCICLPLLIATFMPQFRGNVQPGSGDVAASEERQQLLSSKIMLILGIGGLIFVPIFKQITHLPPYMGMMISLAVVWFASEFIHPGDEFYEERKHLYSARHALTKIEMSSILFFLGILLAVAALESVIASTHADGHPVGLLMTMAESLQHAVPNTDIVVILLGVLSAIIDNVPLVAAVMGMYPMDQFPIDDKLWQLIAFTAGTGGSMLIIGSAAGVAAMGMERIDFIWYMKNIAWLALLGFLAGSFSFLALYPVFHG
ncbi:MAG: sodium:proton antiporter NhaD [Saprospiraceae bacterium]|nr:sodium:proton antiporter NhaD [Saprospiraceae bacterium]